MGAIIEQAKDTIITRYPTSDTLFGPAVIFTLFGDPALRLKYPLVNLQEKMGDRTNDEFKIESNPFRASTIIKAKGKVTIFNATGEKIVEMEVAGHRVWYGKDEQGLNLPAGVYFIRQVEDQQVRKVVILQ